MRFAYIDSQGSEVPIPSVDALALRIELGAIGPDTQLYDAQADRWGPAQTHEIFHTLSRDTGGGFVPPPPVAPPDEEAPAEEELAAEEEEDVALEAAEEEAESEPAEVAAGPDEDFGLDFTLTDAAAGEEEVAEEEPVAEEQPVAVEQGGDAFAFDIGADLAETPAHEVEAEPEPPEEDGTSFDFGEFGSLELESSGAAEEDEPAAAAVDEPMEFGGATEVEDAGGGLELEQPMSEFTPEAPPSWMEEQEGPGGGGDDEALDLSRPGAAADVEERGAPPREGEEVERRERPTPRSRPSPPRRRRRFPVGAFMGLLVLGGAGYGGWYAWPAIQERLAREPEPEVPVRPPVVIPDIPAELLPQMRDIGETALDGMIDDLGRLEASFDLPEQPRDEWLAGIYLANASQFPDVEQYWLEIESFVDSVRVVDTDLFHDRYASGVQRTRLPEDTAAMLVERADSGFLAAADERFEAYAQMDDLINAALDLHQFLLDNEDQVTHEPASGISRDPLLEAVAETESVGREMRTLISRITTALSSLGTLDRVTTQRLTTVLFDRIRVAGFR